VDAFHAAVRTSAIVTHAHAEAVHAALVQAQAIAIVLAEPALAQNPTGFLESLTARLPPVDSAISTALATVRGLVLAGADCVAVARTLGTSTFARESVPAALWSFLACKGGFREAVSGACLLGGDVDSICALVGSLAGALHGAESIPGQWIANLSRESPGTAAIAALADRLRELEPSSRQD